MQKLLEMLWKILLDKIIREEEIEDSLLDELFSIKEASISRKPIKHENTLTELPDILVSMELMLH